MIATEQEVIMFRSRASKQLVAAMILFIAIMDAPAKAGAWSGTPVASAPGVCAATPFTHTLPPPWKKSPNGAKARDWISGDGIMVGL